MKHHGHDVPDDLRAGLTSSDPWNRVADAYADESAWLMRPFSERALALADLPAGARVLDVACGPGTLSLLAAEAGHPVTCLDFSERMIARLETRAAALGIENVTTHCGDGQALTFADSSFDAAFSMFGLMFFPERERALAELHRVLRPGGRVTISSWAPFDQSSLMRLMFGAIQAAAPPPAPSEGDGDGDGAKPAGPPGLPYEDPAVLEAELRAAGFDDVVVHRVEQTFATIADPDELWERLTRANVMVVMLAAQLGEAGWREASARGRAFVRAALPQIGALQSAAWVGTGRKLA
jgi:ubiquinone/menaquinone biosynthesis C-methylase UbiE